MELGPYLYLDLMKKCLTGLIYGATIEKQNLLQQPFDESNRIVGADWPAFAHTMVGLKRLDNIQFCIQDIIENEVPGDLIETGVWRGGATIFMRAVLKAYEITDRYIWVADSFAGLPRPNEKEYPADTGDTLFEYKELAISVEEVQSNFTKYDLLDNQVRFLKGWFKDSLPKAPIDQLAVIRLDGDMYESTMDGLIHLYPKLSIGGYIIIDDYGCIPACKQAVEDYRQIHGIEEEIKEIDWTGVYWQRNK